MTHKKYLEISNNLNFKYTKQIIISFTAAIPEALKQKWSKDHPIEDCYIIQGTSFLKGDYQLPAISENDVVRIYINAHGNVRLSEISNDDETITISPEQMAVKLLPIIKNYNVAINLVVCEAGRSLFDLQNDNGQFSFAAKLQRTLSQLTNRNITVTARAHITSVACIFLPFFNYYSGYKSTVDLKLPLDDQRLSNTFFLAMNFKHKQPGAKVVFYKDGDGQQNRIDAYYYQWKNKVLMCLKRALPSLTPEQHRLVTGWLNEFKTKSFDEIKLTIQTELDNCDSFLQPGFFPIPYLFQSSQLFYSLKKLVEQADAIVNSPYTSKTPVLTGYTFKNKKI